MTPSGSDSSTSSTAAPNGTIGGATCGSSPKSRAIPTLLLVSCKCSCTAFTLTSAGPLTYAVTCSKLRVGEFSGGAYFVTADEIRQQHAYDFANEQREAFAKRRKENAHDNHGRSC